MKQIREKINGISSNPNRNKHLLRICDKLEEYEKTPASTSVQKHGAFEGGLICHINLVINLAIGYATTITNHVCDSIVDGSKPRDLEEISTLCLSAESIITCALIHDLNKVMSASGHQFYVENILTSGKRSDKKPWSINKDCNDLEKLSLVVPDELTYLKIIIDDSSIQYPSGLTSLAVAEMWSPGIYCSLTPEEKQAIIWHEGNYAKGNKTGFTSNESLLWCVIHAADHSAAILGI